MKIYNSENGVSDYIKMADGHDGRAMISELQAHLPQGATVLELGMGPGKDLELLAQHYDVTGSDYSSTFLDRYRAIDPNADLMQLDAVSLDTERRFDAVYSNKVLIHLSDEDLATSILRQACVLANGGVVIHSFWHGDCVEEYDDMTVYCRNEDYLRRAFSERFETIASHRYTELEDSDSVYVVARLRKPA